MLLMAGEFLVRDFGCAKAIAVGYPMANHPIIVTLMFADN
jgi:hypothetical protein